MNDDPHVLSATKMLGEKVLSPSGEELGSLKELIIDLDEGCIAYAVLSFGGFLGMGDKLFAIPWEAFILETTNKPIFILNVEKELLRKAPGFDKDHWPDRSQYEAGWLLDIYKYYGYSPYWTADEEQDH